ncbi:MarR family winged helix-turn-helix transcriptional regulator [Spirillospora sp. CA-253888]
MVKSEEGRMGVVTALVRSAYLVDAVYAASAREHGITSQQGQLMCVLMRRPLGMTELGETLGLAKSSLTGLVDRTARLGLVRREPDPEDGRAVRVALTPEGAALADTFYTETCARIDLLPASLSEAEREALAALLGRVVSENQVPMVFMDGAR